MDAYTKCKLYTAFTLPFKPCVNIRFGNRDKDYSHVKETWNLILLIYTMSFITVFISIVVIVNIVVTVITVTSMIYSLNNLLFCITLTRIERLGDIDVFTLHTSTCTNLAQLVFAWFACVYKTSYRHSRLEKTNEYMHTKTNYRICLPCLPVVMCIIQTHSIQNNSDIFQRGLLSTNLKHNSSIYSTVNATLSFTVCYIYWSISCLFWPT